MVVTSSRPPRVQVKNKLIRAHLHLCICIHTYTYTYTYKYNYTYTYICIPICMHTCVYIHSWPQGAMNRWNLTDTVDRYHRSCWPLIVSIGSHSTGSIDPLLKKKDVFVYVYIYVYVFAYPYLYLCLSIPISIYIYPEVGMLGWRHKSTSPQVYFSSVATQT